MGLFKRLRSKRDLKILKLVKKTNLFKRYFFLIIGTIIYASSYNLFMFKNNMIIHNNNGEYYEYIKCYF